MEQGCGNGLPSDLSAFAKSARTDSGSKSHEHVCSLLSVGTNEELVEAESRAPRAPVLPVGCLGGTTHHIMDNFCPQIVKITREFISDVRVMSCHDHICEKAKKR